MIESGASSKKPRVGCLGVGWIGRHRMELVQQSGAADIVAVCDLSPDAVQAATQVAPAAQVVDSLDDLLTRDIDALMIATPSAMHAEQAIRALNAGKAVFCQKPLGRNADETRRVVAAAREVDRRLGVDLSYRHTRAMQAIRAKILAGELGDIYAVNLAFHNAYGPDKDWFYDVERAGGGCLIDLGIHLVDLAMWALDWPEVVDVRGKCLANGALLGAGRQQVEDYVSAAARSRRARCRRPRLLLAARGGARRRH